MKKHLFLLLMAVSCFSFAQKGKTSAKKSPVKKNVATSKIPRDVQVWTIDAQRAKCEGATTMLCLLVKKQGDKDFNLFYDKIDGLDYQEGFVYTIWVKAEALDRMTLMVGESETKYTLVKVVSKKATVGYSNTIIDNKKPLSGMNVTMTKTLVVNEEKAKCEGNPDAKCLLIKKEGDKEFEVFYQGIDGFTFEEGYRQTIQVSERHVANPMIKEAAPIYTLISVLKKELIFDAKKISAPAPEQPKTVLDNKWYLKKIQETDTSSFIIDDNALWLEFNSTTNKITGKAPCNTFFGGFSSNFVTTLQVMAVGSTKMYCENMKYEELYLSLLQNADRFEIKDRKLSLYKGKRLLLVFE